MSRNCLKTACFQSGPHTSTPHAAPGAGPAANRGQAPTIVVLHSAASCRAALMSGAAPSAGPPSLPPFGATPSAEPPSGMGPSALAPYEPTPSPTPQSSPPLGSQRAVRATLQRFSYAVLYLAEDDHIEVLAVFHSSRDPREWKSRV